MAILEINDKKLKLDQDGHLADFNDWDEEVARYFAREEGIDLTDKHWQLIYYLQDYWRKFAIAPLIRKLCKDNGISQEKLYELFSPTPLKVVAKIAGLPKPTGCI